MLPLLPAKHFMLSIVDLSSAYCPPGVHEASSTVAAQAGPAEPVWTRALVDVNIVLKLAVMDNLSKCVKVVLLFYVRHLSCSTNLNCEGLKGIYYREAVRPDQSSTRPVQHCIFIF